MAATSVTVAAAFVDDCWTVIGRFLDEFRLVTRRKMGGESDANRAISGHGPDTNQPVSRRVADTCSRPLAVNSLNPFLSLPTSPNRTRAASVTLWTV